MTKFRPSQMQQAGAATGNGLVWSGTQWAPATIVDATKVPLSLYSAKGAILIGTAPNTAAALLVGSNGQILTADSTQTTGVKWAAAPIQGITVQDENGTIATGITQLDFQGAGITAALGTGEVIVTVDGSGGGGGGGGGGGSSGQPHVHVTAYDDPPDTVVGTWIRGATSTLMAYQQSDGVVASSAAWKLPIGPGTYDIRFAYSAGLNRGIATIEIDDGAGAYTTLGTVDTYAASTTDGVTTLTGVAITGTAVQRTVRIRAATKNGSSSAYYLVIQAFTFEMTSAYGGGGGITGSTRENFTATAGQTVFGLASLPSGTLSVYRNGLLLASGQYSVAGTSVTLTTAALLGDAITIIYGNLGTGGGTSSGGKYSSTEADAALDLADVWDENFSRTGAPTTIPSTLGWTNQAGATYVERDGVGWLTGTVQGGQNHHIIEKAAPSGSTWTVVGKFTIYTRPINYWQLGISLRDSSTGRLYSWDVEDRGLCFFAWNSPTSYNSESSHLGRYYTTDFYLRVKKNSTTSFDLAYSENGQDWYTPLNANPSGFLTGGVTHVGYHNGVDTSFTSGAPPIIGCHYLRKVA